MEVTKAIQYCRSHSLSIEINYENMDGREMVTKVNFPFDPAVRKGRIFSPVASNEKT